MRHVFVVWEHIVLLVICQYAGKNFRMFSEWLVKAYYLTTFLQLSHENTEQRIIIETYSIQYPQPNQSYYNIPWFLPCRFNLQN